MKTIRTIVPIIALIVASMGLFKAFKNDKQIEGIETRYLENSTKSFADQLTFIRPKTQDKIQNYSDIILDVSYQNSIPENYKVWAIGRHDGRYHLLGNNKSMHIDLPNKIISKSGIRLSDSGEWEIILYLTTLNANKELNERFTLFGMLDLPKGMSILKSIKVFVINNY
jgi:hypothetical protein